ncbi:MAG: 2,3,4,5-tetrahydropyridine-2,6-dicarboxylate N-succinyltransferase, partial [Actinomycetota bacterium]|nr:2,3,4,5-tetrahydropyridine-2,6-dicarboxylate N-succinyltransferase [Actinomycetota bacterium]
MDQPFVSPLPAELDALWERRAELNPNDASARALVVAAVDQLDAGKARVAWVDPASDAVVV